MTAPQTTPQPFVLGAADVPGGAADALLDGAIVAVADVAVLDITGPGALQCMQGLFTNDLEKPGEGAFVYGAVLTPKGMIISDMWVRRDGMRLTLTPPRQGLPALMEVFGRALPPRLARVTDRTESVTVLHVAGPGAFDAAERARISVPPPARAASAIVGDAACTVARPHDGAPFALELTVQSDDALGVEALLAEAGVRRAPTATLELGRILAGWPRVGAEIDGRTLPQEVRYDAINGVSYTKGCYTGQETVARVHFRGHPNRALAGLVWDGPPHLDEAELLQDGKPRGRVTSVAWLAPVERFVGLALVRREVDRDKPVRAAGVDAAVLDLPFALNG